MKIEVDEQTVIWNLVELQTGLINDDGCDDRIWEVLDRVMFGIVRMNYQDVHFMELFVADERK